MKKILHTAAFAAAVCCMLCAAVSCKDSDLPAPEPTTLETPRNVKVQATETTLEVSWDEVEDAAEYTVRLKDAAGAVKEKTTGKNTVLFDELEEQSDYMVCVGAVAGDATHRDSPFCEWIACRTLQGAVTLDTPAIERVEATSQAIAFFLTEVKGATAYIVRLKNGAGEIDERQFEAPEGRFEALTPETDYWLSAGAAGDGALLLDSPFSEWTACRTTEGATALEFAGGTGTPEDPWQIATPGQLALMAERVNSTAEQDAHYASEAYRLTADIDLDGREWQPIGAGIGNENLQMADVNLFKGIFDGAGHTVSGLKADVASETTYALAGLFGILRGAQISDLTVKGSVSGDSSVPAEVYAGGICAIASVYTTFTGCRFEGSVTAGSTSGAFVSSAAGGICGSAAATTLNACSVLVPEEGTIASEGVQAYAGGLCGNGNSGSMQNADIRIEGSVRARVMENASDTELCSVTAGGAVGNNFGLVVSDSEVNISGSVAADACDHPGSVAVAGGLAGSNAADAVGSVTIRISGEISSANATTVCAAGGIGSQQNAGYGVSNVSVVATEGSRIAGTTEQEAAYVGGVQGRVSYQMGSSTGGCSADIAGSMEARAAVFAIAGGVGGSTVGMIRCHAWLRPSAAVIVDCPQNATFGGVLGNASSGNVYACYSILDGSVTVGGEGVTAVAGGVSGVWLGNRMSKRYMNGCYSLLRGAFHAGEGSSATLFGGIVGNKTSPYGYVSTCYWWSGDASVSSQLGSEQNTTGQLEGTSEADLTAAAEEMNAAIADYGVYRYDASLGWLVIDPPAQTDME